MLRFRACFLGLSQGGGAGEQKGEQKQAAEHGVIAPSDFQILVVSLRSLLPVDCDASEGFLPLMAGRLAGGPRPGSSRATENMFLFAKALRDRMQKKIRRVVTGHNAVGKSIFIMDGPSPHVFNRGTGSVVVTDLWETHGTPADIAAMRIP
jgi:hypothetical protein